MATAAKKTAAGAAKATRSKVAKVVEGGKGRATRKAGEAAAKVAENAAKVEALNVQAALEEGKVERIKAASLEAKAAKEAGWKWDKDGAAWVQMDPEEDTPKPPTPNLDAINAGDPGKAPEPAAGTTPRKAAARKAGAPKTPKAERKPLWFLVNGEPVNDAFNNLAGVARATGRNGGKRLGTKDLRKFLVKEGIEDPDNSVWKHTFPNGVVLSTTRTQPKASKKAS